MIYNHRICDISRLSCRTLLILTQITVYAILVLVLSRECLPIQFINHHMLNMLKFH